MCFKMHINICLGFGGQGFLRGVILFWGWLVGSFALFTEV